MAASDLDRIVRASEWEEEEPRSFYEIPEQFKSQLEDWADELSVSQSQMTTALKRHPIEEDRDRIAGCLADCVVLTSLVDDMLLCDEEDIKLESYLDVASAMAKFELRFAALSLFDRDC